MAEWEAMACDLPVLLADDHLVKDFVPSSNPRDDVFKMGWDRKAAKQLWSGFLERRGVEW
jgi:hypothetical protein